jgi:hypothetical protein
MLSKLYATPCCDAQRFACFGVYKHLFTVHNTSVLGAAFLGKRNEAS